MVLFYFKNLTTHQFLTLGDPMDDLGIISQDALIPPQILQEEYPLTFEAKLTVFNARKQAAKILKKEDDRLIVIG